MGNVLDSLYHAQWFPKAIYQEKDKAKDNVYLRVEFGIPDRRGEIKIVKDVTVKGPAQNLSPACFDIPGCVNPNPDLAAAMAKRYWLPTIRTQKEILDYLNFQLTKFPPSRRNAEANAPLQHHGFQQRVGGFSRSKETRAWLSATTRR